MARTVLLTCLLVLFLAVPGLPPDPAAARSSSLGTAYVADELIVRLAPAASPHRFATASGLRLAPGGAAQLPGAPIYRFQILDGAPPHAKAAALAGNPHVIYAEPNYLGQLPEAQKRSSWVVGGDSGAYVGQWAGERIGLGRAHAVARGAGVTVAILDTGVDLDHPALAGRLVAGYDFVAGDDTPREEAGGPDGAFGHGTHVAGLVALAAPEAQIMPLRTLDADGVGDLWTQVLALRYAADRGAAVINLSFSFGQQSALFDDVVAEVTCSTVGYAGCRARSLPGAVVVAAAGNGGTRARQWPGASTIPGIVAVGASTMGDGLAGFSSFGPWVPLAAPGEDVLSSVPGGAYATWSGTSMAAPLVSGVSALVRSTGAQLRPAEVIRRVVGTGSTIDAPVRRRLDAAAAVGAP
ncbi:MAG TPA: S8 family serine peptidase [Chloroflexaceae bacterium]|nr:S8 family serine peptidase [Chloroflexaceae bacterium]